MTEAEWLAATDPTTLLEYVPGKLSNRKLRLLLCSLCHLHWRTVRHEVYREAVKIAERYADGVATEKERELAFRKTGAWHLHQHYKLSHRRYLVSFHNTVAPEQDYSSLDWQAEAVQLFEGEGKAAYVRVLHDIFGNPFRCIAVDRDWLTSTATGIAQLMYDSRDFSAMPILADALQDAGCNDEDILNHCRQPGEHVRGCYLVDLVLGKE